MGSEDKPVNGSVVNTEILDASKLSELGDEERVKLLAEFMKPKDIQAPHLPYGGFVTKYPGADFANASIGEVPFGTTPEELPYLESMLKAIVTPNCMVTSDFLLSDVAKRIVSDETSFDLDNYNLFASGFGFRGAFRDILVQVISKERPFIAYASPNWVFDEMTGMVDGALPYSFHATTADEFVESFRRKGAKSPKLDHVAALVMVDPANPLGYRLQKEHVEALEEVCLANGIVPIFDDVFRGMQPKGDRHSASEYSHHSVVIESSSKRFGRDAYGATWTLIPKGLDLNLTVLPIQCRGCDATAAIAVDALYKTGFDTKISNWVQGNANAFRTGARIGFGDEPVGEFRQAFPGISILTYFLPKGTNFSSADLSTGLKLEIVMSSGLDWVCEKDLYLPKEDDPTSFERMKGERIQNALDYVRICPSKEGPQLSMYSGMLFSAAVTTLMQTTR